MLFDWPTGRVDPSRTAAVSDRPITIAATQETEAAKCAGPYRLRSVGGVGEVVRAVGGVVAGKDCDCDGLHGDGLHHGVDPGRHGRDVIYGLVPWDLRKGTASPRVSCAALWFGFVLCGSCERVGAETAISSGIMCWLVLSCAVHIQ